MTGHTVEGFRKKTCVFLGYQERVLTNLPVNDDFMRINSKLFIVFYYLNFHAFQIVLNWNISYTERKCFKNLFFSKHLKWCWRVICFSTLPSPLLPLVLNKWAQVLYRDTNEPFGKQKIKRTPQLPRRSKH